MCVLDNFFLRKCCTAVAIKFEAPGGLTFDRDKNIDFADTYYRDKSIVFLTLLIGIKVWGESFIA